MNQKTALDILKMGYNVFLTGPAGSGKTYVLNQYIDYLKNKGITVAVTASTGIAATHLSGRTIHSWSGLGVRDTLDEKSLRKISRKKQLKKDICKTKVLVVDEISMLHASQLDAVSDICKHVRKSDLPFGGIQVIFCGDFFQLPPVQRESRIAASFAYNSHIWNEMDMKVCYLDEQHRQKDSSLMRVLNDIRRNVVSEETRSIVDSCRGKIFPEHIRPSQLFTHNADADRINEQELKKLPGNVFAYTMQSFGKENLSDILKKSCLAPERLLLKKGALVMFVKNNFEKGYVNGTLGKIVDFEKETKLPMVKTTTGKIITADPATWAMEEGDDVIAGIKQLPLRLAWAITVHKSQGMSLDAVEIDLGKSFEYGMGYVALSRVRTLSGLSVLSVNEMAFQVHADVYEKDQEFVELSKSALEEIGKMSEQDKNMKQKMFMGEEGEKSEGKSKKKKSTDAKTFCIVDIRKKFAKAYMPWTEQEDELLRKNFTEGKTVSELSKIFERNKGAIRSRLRKIGVMEDE